MDPGIGDQVGLELGEVYIESSVKSQRGSDGGDNLANQTIEIGVGWSLDVQVTAADVVDGLVVHHEGTVGVLQGGVGGQHRVVGLHHGGRDLGGRVNGKLQLGLLPVVHRETLHEEGGEAGASSSSEGMEHQESLEAGAVVSHFPDSLENQVHDLLTDGVVAPGVVVSRVLLATHQLLGVEHLPVDTSPDLVNHGGLEVHKHGPGHVLPAPGLREEGVEAVVLGPDGLVAGHGAVRLDAVLEAVQLPAGVTHLHSGLADMDADTLTLQLTEIVKNHCQFSLTHLML